MVVSVGAVGYFVPIFAFLLVALVIYALLKKTGVLGGSEGISLFISFILAAFFVVEASLVDFVQFSSAWFSIIVIALFFLMVVSAFLPGVEPLAFLTKNNWFSWTMLGVIIALFVIIAILLMIYVFSSNFSVKDFFGFL